MAESDLFDRARDVCAGIKAHQDQLADENYNTMRANRLQDLQKAISAFAMAVENCKDAKERGLTVALQASVPTAVEVDDPTEFVAGNDLTRLEETLLAAVISIDASLDQAFGSAVAELGAHPAGERELEILIGLDLEAAEAALQALASSSERWWSEIEKSKRPHLEIAGALARELDDAWAALADSGITQEQVDLLRRLSGDCVPLTTVKIEDISWLFEIGFASTLRLCSNSARK